MFTGLALLKNSRNDESEADEYSFKYLQSTNWYPGAISFFFDKVKGQGGSAIEGLLSTHPLPQDRLDDVNKRVKDAKIPPPTESNLSSRTYMDFKKRLP
jgi:predicted Zn-dependent protease